MPRFVALLRGVNVGKGNRIAMADFRRLLEGAGCTDVLTLLNSGNAVFGNVGRSSSAHARTIAAALRDEFGLSVPVVVESAKAFAAVIAECPLEPPPSDHSKFLVAFAHRPGALGDLQALARSALAAERFVIGQHAAYLHCAGGILHSEVARALLGKAGQGVTTRNWATVLKLEAVLRSGSV